MPEFDEQIHLLDIPELSRHSRGEASLSKTFELNPEMPSGRIPAVPVYLHCVNSLYLYYGLFLGSSFQHASFLRGKK